MLLSAFEEIVNQVGTRFCPAYRFFSQASRARLEQNLLFAAWQTHASNYFGFCLASSLALAFALLVFSVTVPMLLPAAPLAFAACFYALLRLPPLAAKQRRRELEWEACFALRKIAAQLDAGLSFEECLENAASPTLLGAEFSKINRETNVGASTPQALQSFAVRTDSLFLKKAAAQLAFAYSHGAGAEALRRTSEEHASVLRMRLKEYNATLALHSLGFIACVAVIPAVFLVYSLVGSALFTQVPAENIFAAFFVLFPLLSAAVLASAVLRRP